MTMSFRKAVLEIYPNAKLYNAPDERKNWNYCYFVALDANEIDLVPRTFHSPLSAWRYAYSIVAKQCPFLSAKPIGHGSGLCYFTECTSQWCPLHLPGRKE